MQCHLAHLPGRVNEGWATDRPSFIADLGPGLVNAQGRHEFGKQGGHEMQKGWEIKICFQMSQQDSAM